MDLDGPALAPPEGVTSNFDNPDNQNELALGVLVTCVAIATFSFLLRAYGRIYLLRRFQIEEALVTISYGLFWGCAWPTFELLKKPGYFVHQWDIRLRDLIPITYWIFIFGVCYSIILPLLKVAILVEWCRIFVPKGMRTKSYFWWAAVVIIVLQILGGIAIVILLNLRCIPHTAIWDFTIEPKKCFDQHMVEVVSASIHLACDFAILLLPQRVIWTLQMPWQKRLGVSIICGLGVLACVSASFRLAVTVSYGKAEDAIYHLPPVAFWATTEMACGFFIVSVPCIPRILRDTGVITKIKNTLGGTTNAKSSQMYAERNRHNHLHHSSTGLSSNHGKLATTTTVSSYHKLDEDGIPMRGLSGSESTEHLHGDGITRTTQITITDDSHSGSTSMRPSVKY
ncbi:hypothetical protein AJ80_09385 [Polytolypa hystricis UAMH7299]|uniref:Rhodopsin domain-containing protein n=1 Tax=Polytolypa hystricis (strain UAMH7299) TaxID=1447883 RepID=A0A2B7WS86_POLH7|nr:hypothetical protein AJ80_09385 [Polytolypa hystricis UAMH7299]